MRRALCAVAATGSIALGACGTSHDLTLEGLEPDPSFTESGTSREPSSPDARGTERFYRYEASDGDELTWTLALRNDGDEPVRVVGAVSDESRERVLRPTGLDGDPVTIQPGATGKVGVRAEVVECEAGEIETLYGTGTTELELESPPGEDVGTEVVDLGAVFEVPSDAAC